MDVYLSARRDLLVVKRGCPIPPVAAPGSWRKRKKRVVKVSEEIGSALQMHGYYMRKLRDLDRSKDERRIGIWAGDCMAAPELRTTTPDDKAPNPLPETEAAPKEQQ
jgi:hypothetical protein